MNISSSSMMNAYSGIQTGFNNLAQTSQQLANPNQPDKAQALVQHKLDANLVEVNAKSLKTADQMIGTLLDVMA
jgi:flagellar hook protein FlgE